MVRSTGVVNSTPLRSPPAGQAGVVTKLRGGNHLPLRVLLLKGGEVLLIFNSIKLLHPLLLGGVAESRGGYPLRSLPAGQAGGG